MLLPPLVTQEDSFFAGKSPEGIQEVLNSQYLLLNEFPELIRYIGLYQAKARLTAFFSTILDVLQGSSTNSQVGI